MPGTGLAVQVGAGLGKKVGGWLLRKITKKTAKRAIVAVAGSVALEKVVQRAGGGGGGGGAISWPSSISPFERGRGIFGKTGVQPGESGACPSGYHLDKATRSKCVRNRRMNFANGRAAKRAGRRLRGTVKLLKKSFSFVQAKRPAGKFIVKKGR